MYFVIFNFVLAFFVLLIYFFSLGVLLNLSRIALNKRGLVMFIIQLVKIFQIVQIFF